MYNRTIQGSKIQLVVKFLQKVYNHARWPERVLGRRMRRAERGPHMHLCVHRTSCQTFRSLATTATGRFVGYFE